MSIIEIAGQLFGYGIVIYLLYLGARWYKKNTKGYDKTPISDKKIRFRWQMTKEEIAAANNKNTQKGAT